MITLMKELDYIKAFYIFLYFFSLNRDCLFGKFLLKNKVTTCVSKEILMINIANIKQNITFELQIIASIIKDKNRPKRS